MIKRIETDGVGPSKEFEINFAKRLTLLTGDNGLGKTLFLDLAWWSLTLSWANEEIKPKYRRSATIKTEIDSDGEPSSKAEYDISLQRWIIDKRSKPDGVVVYVTANSSILVWDCYRNRHPDLEGLRGEWFERDPDNRPLFTKLTQSELWNGSAGEVPWCNGMLRDWVTWQFDQRPSKKSAFAILKRLLVTLFPENENPQIIHPQRFSLSDARDVPMLEFPYGPVPLTVLSSAVKRIISVAYSIVWAWQEHLEHAASLNKAKTSNFVLIFDEVELHLHPKWQRHILPALMKVAKELDPDLNFQAIVSTHSPLILASMEPSIKEIEDKLLHLYMESNRVKIEELQLIKTGTVLDWLASEAFGIEHARSIESQKAIESAEKYLLNRTKTGRADRNRWNEINMALKRTLAGDDEFWIRWISKAEDL